MRRLVLVCCGVVAAACGKTRDSAPADTAAMSPPAAAAPEAAPAAAPISLAGIAGKWSMQSVPDSGDTAPTRYTLTATPDTAGWTLQFAGRSSRERTHVVAVAGDSVVLETGPYESARRKGVQTVTRTTLREVGGKLVGTSVAHYKVSTPDSVLHLRTEGTRIP